MGMPEEYHGHATFGFKCQSKDRRLLGGDSVVIAPFGQGAAFSDLNHPKRTPNPA
jgi:hypothetical protein